jgi:hypothetical protein
MERVSLSELNTGVWYTVKANAGYFSKVLILVAIRDGLFTFENEESRHVLTRYDISDGHVQVYRVASSKN